MSTDFALCVFMNADTFVKLVEEMVDLKINMLRESTLKPSPEVAKVLQQKMESDRRRLELVKAELARALTGR